MKLAYLYECFKSIDVYQTPVNDSKKEDFFSDLKNQPPSDEEVEGTK